MTVPTITDAALKKTKTRSNNDFDLAILSPIEWSAIVESWASVCKRLKQERDEARHFLAGKEARLEWALSIGRDIQPIQSDATHAKSASVRFGSGTLPQRHYKVDWGTP